MMKNLRKIFLSLFLVFSFNQASWGNNPFELEFDQDDFGVLKITRKLEESDIQNLQGLLKGLDFEIKDIIHLDFSNRKMEDKEVILIFEEFLPIFPNLDKVVIENDHMSSELATNLAKDLLDDNIFKMSKLIQETEESELKEGLNKIK